MSYHYGVPPTHYNKMYDSSSPYSSGEYVQYVPHPDHITPSRRHSRKVSQASPRVGGWYSPAGSPPPDHDAYIYNVSPSKQAYVSYDQRTGSYSTPNSKPNTSTNTMRAPSHPVYTYRDGDEYAEPQATYIYREPKSKHAKKPSTDSYFYFNQEQIYQEQPKRTHSRKTSTATKPSPSKPQTRAQTRSQTKAVPVANEQDAKRAGIPAGYSTKNWDPTELPIILLGSVFDANSLGKWIYDWTVYHHGASTPMADIAGDLWLLLIKLAGKMKRAEECVARIRSHDDQEMVEDFIISGGRLWEKFKGLLKDCEYFMLKAAKRQGSKTMMGRNAGTEFVDSIFGRDRYLDSTEKIMNSVRLWTMRFDVNCEDIIRRPSGA